MTWTQCSGTRSMCSSGCGRAFRLGPGAPRPPAQSLCGARRGLCLPARCSLLVAAWHGRSCAGLAQDSHGLGPHSSPWTGRRPAPLNPSHWSHCCCLLSVGTPRSPLRPLSGPWTWEGGKCRALPVSRLTSCPSLPWPLATARPASWTPKLCPGTREPTLWGPIARPGMPGFHHCRLQLAMTAGGIGLWDPASWCQSFGAKA